MYELRTAISYLIPRKGQLSISVVGLIAVLVIQAITWLILVFFSTTEGFEFRWSQKIISIVGPMRIVPTPAYFDSPYYKLDLYSSRHNYAPERLSAKQDAGLPYDPQSDPPLSPSLSRWYSSHVQKTPPIPAMAAYLHKSGFAYRFFESTVSHLTISSLESSPSHSLSQYTCLLGIDGLDAQSMIPVSELSTPEVEHLLALLKSSEPASIKSLEPLAASIHHMQVIITHDSALLGHHVTPGTELRATISFSDNIPQLSFFTSKDTSITVPLSAAPPLSVLSVALAHPPLAIPTDSSLPYIPSLGYPALLPKQMRQQGARLLDTGTFQFTGAGMGGPETLTLPFYIAGFFDSGILPIGGKLAITSRQAIMAIQPDLSPEGPIASSGIIVDVPSTSSLEAIQQSLQKGIDAIAPGLFAVQRFDQYEVTSELFQQLASEHTLFNLISIIIIFVACSNIFSMLFILAHDRRKEIAVLRALGASSRSIIVIFLLAGLLVGLFGSTFGAALAAVTLHYLPELLAFIGSVQGHAVLHQGIYGDISPQMLSFPTLVFAFTTISITSSLAGALAAVRACKMNVSEALKS
jgi:lipoprotein-releasing system permease protein